MAGVKGVSGQKGKELPTPGRKARTGLHKEPYWSKGEGGRGLNTPNEDRIKVAEGLLGAV